MTRDATGAKYGITSGDRSYHPFRNDSQLRPMPLWLGEREQKIQVIATYSQSRHLESTSLAAADRREGTSQGTHYPFKLAEINDDALFPEMEGC
jgi:hypothetical protein